MADRPSTPWNLQCPWCAFFVVVNARGSRGSDQGAGVEAAQLMASHALWEHNRTWKDFLAAEYEAPLA